MNSRNTAYNEHIGKMAAASPLKIQCKFANSCPAASSVKPPLRQYATTLNAMADSASS